MKLWAALRDAVQGWAEIIQGRGSWREQFSFSAAGLVTALFIFFFFAFLAIAFGSMGTGMPAIIGVLIALAVQGLAVLALVIGVVLAKMVLKSDAPVMGFLVPGVYALVFYLILGSILAALGGSMIVLALLAIGGMFFRLGRMAGGWTIGVSAAFAVFTVVLLVAMPLTLYMLSNPAGSPI